MNEALASLTLDTASDGFRFLHFPQEILLNVIEVAHEAYVGKEKHEQPHPLTNLRL